MLFESKNNHFQNYTLIKFATTVYTLWIYTTFYCIIINLLFSFIIGSRKYNISGNNFLKAEKVNTKINKHEWERKKEVEF